MSNVLAGIGVGQLEVLNERVNSRRKNFEYYKNVLSNINGISFQEEQPGFFSNRWLTCIIVNPIETNGISREDIRISLEKENIESRPLWKPMHMQPVFDKADYIGGAICEQLFEKGLCLPSGSNLTNEKLNSVCQIITRILSKNK